jgi:phosphohistidine swiveling domain-containing protein
MLLREVADRLSESWSKVSEKVARQAFFDDYVLIFTINLLAQQSLEQLKRALPSKISLVEALSYFPKDLLTVLTPPANIVGNTFEFNDVSPFIASVRTEVTRDIPAEIPISELKSAQNYLRLREYGRWLALRHINRLREFVTVEKIAQPGWSLPAIITDVPKPTDTRAPVGVSAGKATGKLVSTPEKDGILVVSSLTPELAHHAEILKGVIADHGGLLSHFSIIARELGLPVIVNYPIHELKIGEKVTIDGSTGRVQTR